MDIHSHAMISDDTELIDDDQRFMHRHATIFLTLFTWLLALFLVHLFSFLILLLFLKGIFSSNIYIFGVLAVFEHYT